MSFAFATAQFDTQRNIQRGVAIALLLCIHVAAIALLLAARNPDASLPRAVREIIISFPAFHPKPVPIQWPRSEKPERTHGIAAPIYKMPSQLTIPATQPDLSGVEHSLFGCDPAAMKNADEQAGCNALAARPGQEEVGMPKKSRVVQTARWMNELAIKHSRVLVPCLGFYKGRQPFGASKSNDGVMVDMVCVAKGLLNGFGESK